MFHQCLCFRRKKCPALCQHGHLTYRPLSFPKARADRWRYLPRREHLFGGSSRIILRPGRSHLVGRTLSGGLPRFRRVVQRLARQGARGRDRVTAPLCALAGSRECVRALVRVPDPASLHAPASLHVPASGQYQLPALVPPQRRRPGPTLVYSRSPERRLTLISSSNRVRSRPCARLRIVQDDPDET